MRITSCVHVLIVPIQSHTKLQIKHGEEEVMDEDTQGSEMPKPDQCHMDVESNIGAEGSS